MKSPIATAIVAILATAHAALAQHACPPQRIEPPLDPVPLKYGTFNATNGRFWFVSDPQSLTRCPGSPFSCATGAVHVYERVDGRLQFHQTLVPPDIGLNANFGKSMAVDGDRLVVGAPLHTQPGGLTWNGMVFEYGFDGERWVETDRIPPPPDLTRDFGESVALRGDTLMVWSSATNPDSVLVYERSAGEWVLAHTIAAPPESRTSDFGRIIRFDDEWLFVTAPRDSATVRFGGSVFVYQREADGAFTFFQKLTIDFYGQFGTALAYNGRSLLVGVPAYQPDVQSQGGVFAYSFDGARWVLDERITLSDADRNDEFGLFIAAEDDTMIASAFSRRTPVGMGVVVRFEQRPDGSWAEVGHLPPDHDGRSPDYGFGLALREGKALVNSANEIISTGERAGAAYFFDLGCGACPTDLDGDGVLTIFDYMAFFNAFDAADPIADIDGDGEFTLLDFLAFQTAFDAGC